MTESRWIWLWWLGQWYLIEPWYRDYYLPLWPGYMAKRAKWGLTGGRGGGIMRSMSAVPAANIREQRAIASVTGAGSRV